MGKVFLVWFSCDWRVTSATDMSDQGGCSCVQGISANLCEENIMFWEVSGIVLKLFFLGLFLSLIVPSGSLSLSACSSYLPALVFCLLCLSLVPDCRFCF